MMRNSRPFVFVLALFAAPACFDEPNYEGRLCESGDICPAGYTCGADGRCHAGGPSDPDDASVRDADLSDATEADATFADAEVNDAGGNDPARCAEAPAYPRGSWETRTFRLSATDGLETCLGVDSLPGTIIDRNYGSAGPAPDLVDRFGTQYRQKLMFLPGVQTLHLSYDDGVRVYFDEVLIFEDWRRGVVVLGEDVLSPFVTGEIDVRVEHFENDGLSRIHLAIERGCRNIDAPTEGWNIAYYRANGTNIDLDHCFGVEYLASDIFQRDYGQGAPVPTAPVDGWAAVAVGRRILPGLTRFRFSHDEALRVLVDQTEVYNTWQGPVADLDIYVYATGERTVQLELVDVRERADIYVTWNSACADDYAVSENDWIARYYGVNYDGSVNPPSWTLDYLDCLAVEQVDTPGLSLDWMGSGPTSLVQNYGIVDLFGAEFTAPRTFAQNTQISLTHDDGLRVYVDGLSVYDNWTAPQVITGAMLQLSGPHELHLQYFENLGGAQLHFNY